MDPWAPIPQTVSSCVCDLDSERYVAALESRLNKLKESRNSEPTAKELLAGLSQAKEAEMINLTQSSSGPYISSYACTDGDDANIESPSLVMAIQRKLQPEKQALSTEELLELVENDELAKIRHEMENLESVENNADTPEVTDEN